MAPQLVPRGWGVKVEKVKCEKFRACDSFVSVSGLVHMVHKYRRNHNGLESPDFQCILVGSTPHSIVVKSEGFGWNPRTPKMA